MWKKFTILQVYPWKGNISHNDSKAQGNMAKKRVILASTKNMEPGEELV
jgi:hypothetical protein